MAAKKKRAAKPSGKAHPAKSSAELASREPSGRLRRSDDEKLRIVKQVLASGNQSAEIKALGIYPNQFYDWKKRFAGRSNSVAGVSNGKKVGRPPALAVQNATEEAKAFLHGKASLLQRLRVQRAELDTLIAQLDQ